MALTIFHDRPEILFHRNSSAQQTTNSNTKCQCLELFRRERHAPDHSSIAVESWERLARNSPCLSTPRSLLDRLEGQGTQFDITFAKRNNNPGSSATILVCYRVRGFTANYLVFILWTSSKKSRSVLALHACVSHESWQSSPSLLVSSGMPAHGSVRMCLRAGKRRRWR